MTSLIGESAADALWSHLAVAENARLISVYGYAKDNAFPPHLSARLLDACFVKHLLISISDDDTVELSQSVQRLLDAVAVPADVN